MALMPINILRKKKTPDGFGRHRMKSSAENQGVDNAVTPARRAAAERSKESVDSAQRKSPDRTTEASGRKGNPNAQNRANQARLEQASHGNAPSDSLSGSAPSGSQSNSERGGRSQLAPIDIAVPLQIDKYTIGGKLGSGTCGVVHKGLDTVLDREVAIKLSPIGEPHLSTGKVPGAQRAYQTEIFAAGRLRHPNIVTVYDAGQYDDLNYLVMEAVTGQSLKHFGKGQTLLPVFRSIEIIIDCCKALDYSHNQGILHRDIKPANVMIADNGQVKLLDFGIAVGLNDEAGLSRKGPTLGTPNYMSPEQILGKRLGPASDFYSLATVLFELVTGRQLFKAKKVKDLFRTVVHQEAPKLQEVRSDLPAEFSQIVAKALRKKPDSRYQSGAELIADLEPFVEYFRNLAERSPEQVRHVRQLKSLSFFNAVNDSDVARLLNEANVREFEAHDELLEGGNIERRLLILTEGLVKAYSAGRLCHLYSPGDCLGELGFMQGNREENQFFAVGDVKALEVCSSTLAVLPPSMHLRYYKKISDILVKRLSSGESRLQLDLML